MRQKPVFISLFFIVFVIFLLVILQLFLMPPRDITIKDITQVSRPNSSQEKFASPEVITTDRAEEKVNEEVKSGYYIIVGSFNNLPQAQQEVEGLNKYPNLNVAILPLTKEGNYRISCGKYASIEEAKSQIENIKTNIKFDAWILKEK